MAEDYIESITVGGEERLSAPTYWTGDPQSFAGALAGNLSRGGYDLFTFYHSTAQYWEPPSGLFIAALRITMSLNGKFLYVTGEPNEGPNPKFFQWDRIWQVDLDRAWDLTSLQEFSSAKHFSFSASATADSISPPIWRPDGTRVWMKYAEDIFATPGSTAQADFLYQFDVETPWQITTISTATAVNIRTGLEAPDVGFAWSQDGKIAYVTELVVGSGGAEGITEYKYDQPYDIASFLNRDVQSDDIQLRAADGTKLFAEFGWTQFRFADCGNTLWGHHAIPLTGGSSLQAIPFYKFDLAAPYDITSIVSTAAHSSTGTLDFISASNVGESSKAGLGYHSSFDSNASTSVEVDDFWFTPDGCSIFITENDVIYRVELACGSFETPSSDQAANNVAGFLSESSAPYIGRDPASFSWLDGNCVIIESTALGACASEEVVVVKRGNVDFTISSKFLGNDSFCGGLEAHLFDSYGVQNSTATNLITGADHLAGEVVGAWGDGQDLGFYKVSSTGTFTIPVEATSVTYGIPYTAWFKSAKLAYGVEAGNTALVQRKKVNHLGFVLYCAHARGLEYGPSTDKLNPMPRIEAGKLVSPDAIWPHYDEETIEFPGEWDTDSRVVLKAQAPRGVTVLAAVMQLDTREKI